LPDSESFYGKGGAEKSDDDDLGALIPAMIGAVVLLLAIAFIFHKRRK